MALKLTQQIKQTISGVKGKDKNQKSRLPSVRTTPLPGPISVTEVSPEGTGTIRKNVAQSTAVVEVQSSKGKIYRLTIPVSYVGDIPIVWSWNEQRYRVADKLAAGIAIVDIASEENMPSRMTIYAWLQHPEFKEYVDALVLETGFANKRERIAGLARASKVLYDKLIRDIDGVELTDKSLGAVIMGVQNLAKQVAQEKEEFVEQSKVEQETNLKGTVGLVHTKLDDIIAAYPEDKRDELQRELNRMGDAIVAQVLGGAVLKQPATLNITAEKVEEED